MRKLITLLLLASLACGTLPLVKSTIPSHFPAPAPSMYAVRMVATGDLHIRVEPGNLQTCADPCYLHPGDVVTCYQFVTIGDEVWCKHAGGWSNARWMRVAVEMRRK